MDYPGLAKEMGVEVGVELEGRERERGHCNGRFINECRHFELTGTKIKRKMSFFFHFAFPPPSCAPFG